jgi:hypothetical protein
MKIDQGKWPILQKDLSLLEFDEWNNEEAMAFGKNEVKFVLESSETKVLYYTATFMNAIKKFKKKLVPLIPQIKNGSYIIMSGTGAQHVNSCIINKTDTTISFTPVESGKYIGIVDYHHFKDEMKHFDRVNDMLGDDDEDGNYPVYQLTYGWLQDDFNDKHGNLSELTAVLGLLLYQYAEIETLVLDKVTKKGKLNKEKYITYGNAGIKILDSTWFTKLVQTAGFKVSGHFRLQPYGTGMNQRKLIWISEFEKHGYKREAKISNNH